jgi:tetratricopeptide (TPR) repeat protein
MDASRDEGLAAELELLDAAFPADVEAPESWPRADELLSTVDGAALDEAEGDELPAAVSLFDRVAHFEYARGRFEEALARARTAVEVAAKLGEVAAAGKPHRTLALVLFQFDRDQEALEHLERALRLHSLEKDFDDEVLEDQVLISQALANLERLGDAREEVEQALSSIPPGAPGRAAAKARGHLAWLLYREGKYREAVALGQEALQELADACGPRHPESLSLRIDLGVILAADSRFEQSREELEVTVALSCEVLGEFHPSVGMARSMLGTTFQMEGEQGGGSEEFQAAKEALEGALKHGEEVLPAGHRSIDYRHLWLARTLESLNDMKGALSHIDTAIALSKSVDPPNPGRLAGGLIARAKVLERSGNDAEAYEIFAAARSILATAPESQARRRGECEIGMGRAAEEQGNLTTARTHLEAAVLAYGEVESDRTAAGWEQGARVELATVSARIAEELAASCRALGQPDAARTVLDRGRELFVEVLVDISSEADLTGAIAVTDAARQSSVPKVAFEALERGESLLDDDANDSERRRVGAAWHRLGRSCRLQDEVDSALWAFRKALPMLIGDSRFMGVTYHDIGEIHAERGEWPEAIELYRRAVKLKSEGGGPQVDRTSTLIALGRALLSSNDSEGALEAYADCQAILDSLPERDLGREVLLLEDLGNLKSREDNAVEAAELFGRAVETAREADDPQLLANSLLALGRARHAGEDHDGAMEAFAERLEILRELPHPDLQGEGVTLHDIANLRRDEDRVDEAAALLREAVDRKRRGGQSPRDLGLTLLVLGRDLVTIGDLTGAIAAFEERLEVLHGLDEPEQHSEAVTWHEIGSALSKAERHDEAIAAFRRAEVLERDAREMYELATTLLALGRTLKQTGDYAGALAAYEERLQIIDDPRSRGVTLHDIATVHRARGEFTEAAAIYRKAAAEKKKGDSPPIDQAITLLALGRVRRAAGDWKAALEAFEGRLELLDSLPARDNPATATTLQEIADTLAEIGRTAEAASRYKEAVARQREVGGDSGVLTKLLLSEANLRLSRREFDQAWSLAEEGAALLSEGPEADSVQLAAALMTLGEVAMLSEEAEQAIPLFKESDQLLVESSSDPIDLAILRRQLAEAYSATGHEDDSSRYRESARAALSEGLEKGVKNTAMMPTLAVLAVEVGSSDVVETIAAEARKLVASNPTNPDHKKLLANVLREAGRAYEMVAGEPARAAGQYRAAANCLREVGNRFGAATCLRSVAEIQAAAGEHADALATLEERLGLLREEPPSDERSRLELTTLERMAKAQLAAGSDAAARLLVEQAERLLTEGGTADEEIAAGLRDLANKLNTD